VFFVLFCFLSVLFPLCFFIVVQGCDVFRRMQAITHYVGWLVCWSVRPLVCPHITLSSFFLIQKLDVSCLWNRDILWLNLEALITKGQSSFSFRITSLCTWFGLSTFCELYNCITHSVGPSIRYRSPYQYGDRQLLLPAKSPAWFVIQLVLSPICFFIFRCEEHLYKRLRRSVGWSVHRSPTMRDYVEN
jgi:hypothetical protein